MSNHLHIRRSGWLLARAALLCGIVVLVCVPALTRVGQKLETASRAPSFSRNIDCPPKKVTVAPVVAVASPIPLKRFETVRLARFTPALDAARPRPPQFVPPLPLRAPPSGLLA